MAKPRILEDIDQLYNKIAEVIDEILPNQLMNKNTYDADNDGIVDKADHATNATNAKNLKKSDGTTVDADTITTKLLKIPTYNGNTNQVLTSNGDGTASWKDAYAKDIGYDNTTSKLTSTNVQGAIDEVNSNMKTGINDVKAQLTSGEHEFRFGVTADGEFGYHKEVEGADTVVPFKTKGSYRVTGLLGYPGYGGYNSRIADRDYIAVIFMVTGNTPSNTNGWKDRCSCSSGSLVVSTYFSHPGTGYGGNENYLGVRIYTDVSKGSSISNCMGTVYGIYEDK